jgi:hypothetical protein
VTIRGAPRNRNNFARVFIFRFDSLLTDSDGSVCLNARRKVREPPNHPGEQSISRMKQKHPASASECVKTPCFRKLPRLIASGCFPYHFHK